MRKRRAPAMRRRRPRLLPRAVVRAIDEFEDDDIDVECAVFGGVKSEGT